MSLRYGKLSFKWMPEQAVFMSTRNEALPHFTSFAHGETKHTKAVVTLYYDVMSTANRIRIRVAVCQ